MMKNSSAFQIPPQPKRNLDFIELTLEQIK